MVKNSWKMEKSVKKCQNQLESTFFRQKRRNLVPDNTTDLDEILIHMHYMYIIILWQKKLLQLLFCKLSVVLSGTRFLLFWRKKVLSNWFWHFFMHNKLSAAAVLRRSHKWLKSNKNYKEQPIFFQGLLIFLLNIFIICLLICNCWNLLFLGYFYWIISKLFQGWCLFYPLLTSIPEFRVNWRKTHQCALCISPS